MEQILTHRCSEDTKYPTIVRRKGLLLLGVKQGHFKDY